MVIEITDFEFTLKRITADGGATWKDGTLTKRYKYARANSDLAADVFCGKPDELNVFVYFQDQKNRIRQLSSSGPFPEPEWTEKKDFPLWEGLSGTSIVCRHDYSGKRWIYFLFPEGTVQKLTSKNGELCLCMSESTLNI